MKDSCGQIVKTKKILEKELERVEKVKRAREKALVVAMEKSAQLILKERKYESSIKRHNAMQQEESLMRKDWFESIYEKRDGRR
jgi:hypothetical protein